MPGRGVSKVEWHEGFKQWVVLDGNGHIVDMHHTRLQARAASVRFAEEERWLMGKLGNLRLWPQNAVSDAFGVTSRTIRDAMKRDSSR